MTEKVRRLFFALWPDDETRSRIVERTAAHVLVARGRPTPRERLHVTVAFLGSVAESRLACVEAAAARVTGSAIDLVLDHVDHWRRSSILSLQPVASPANLDQLVADLWQELSTCAFEPETRPFRAHVTLARDAHPPRGVAPDIEPIVWRVHELSLIESITEPAGARYERLQSWPLAHENPASSASFAPVAPRIP